MKLIKRIPFQIFILILCAGIAGTSGMLIMRHNLNEISKNYGQIIEGSLRACLVSSENNTDKSQREHLKRIL